MYGKYNLAVVLYSTRCKCYDVIAFALCSDFSNIDITSRLASVPLVPLTQCNFSLNISFICVFEKKCDSEVKIN